MNKQKMLALGIAGFLIYVSTTKAAQKNRVLAGAALAIGAVTAVRQVPVANQYLG